MSRATQTVIDEPVEGFDISDLFLSRTDERGPILSGNTTFRRLSGYDWPELINAPHRLIRHPDMPKTAFWLVWKMLKDGRPCGAYVKNRAKCGRYYWVYAALVPVDGGYLSVRLKPTTPYLGVVQDLYAAILSAEEGGAKFEDCHDMLEAAVQSHGFRNYTAFMGFVLGAELAARDAALGRQPAQSIAEFENMGNCLSQLAEEVKVVRSQFQEISNSPKNLSILGSRLSSGREAMQVVALNYEVLSEELLGVIAELSESLDRLLDRAYQGRMGHCASLLYEEAVQDYAENEPNRETWGHAKELEGLRAALAGFCETANRGCQEIRAEAGNFFQVNARLRKLMSGLAMTRVICRIETASVRENTDSIDEISARLAQFQQDLGGSLDRIHTASTALQSHIPA